MSSGVSSALSSVTGNASAMITQMVDKNNESSVPEYKAAKDSLKTHCDNLHLMSAAAIICGLALAVLGIATCFSAPVIGASLIIISATTLYFSYNCCIMLENVKEGLENPAQYQDKFGLTMKFNPNKVKPQLEKNTLWFAPFVDYAVSSFCHC